MTSSRMMRTVMGPQSGFKDLFLQGNIWIWGDSLINHIPDLVCIMHCCQISTKTLSKPVVIPSNDACVHNSRANVAYVYHEVIITHRFHSVHTVFSVDWSGSVPRLLYFYMMGSAMHRFNGMLLYELLSTRYLIPFFNCMWIYYFTIIWPFSW